MITDIFTNVLYSKTQVRKSHIKVILKSADGVARCTGKRSSFSRDNSKPDNSKRMLAAGTNRAHVAALRDSGWNPMQSVERGTPASAAISAARATIVWRGRSQSGTVHAGAAAGHSRPAVPEYDAAVLRRPCCSVLRSGAKLKHVCANETVAVHPHVRRGPHRSFFFLLTMSYYV